VLPAFRLLENTPTGDDAYHGRTGPLPIRQRTDDELTPSLRGFVDASVAYGFKRVHDFNGAEQNGADGYPVDVVDGVRQNVGLVYLTAEVRRRPNLTIRPSCCAPASVRPLIWSPWASKSSLTCPSASACRTSLVTPTPTRWPPATWR
jgi:choline dehydrogenase-like flavoprotein